MKQRSKGASEDAGCQHIYCLLEKAKKAFNSLMVNVFDFAFRAGGDIIRLHKSIVLWDLLDDLLIHSRASCSKLC